MNKKSHKEMKQRHHLYHTNFMVITDVPIEWYGCRYKRKKILTLVLKLEYFHGLNNIDTSINIDLIE